MLQLQLALLLSVQPQLLLLFPLPKIGNPQELSATSIISAALPILRPGLLDRVFKQMVQVLKLTPRAAQVAETCLILSVKLWVHSSPVLQQFLYARPGLAACDRLSSSIVMKPLPPRCCKLLPCHSLSVPTLHTPSVTLLLFLSTPTPPSPPSLP